jgi:D-alanine-D-alanine ligase
VSPRIRLVLLFGGESAEHDVSCVTARDVLAATDATKYELLPVGITRDGTWVQADDALTALEAGSQTLPTALSARGTAVDPLPVLAPTSEAEQVVVFPLLHGPLGEDGTVQGLLELADVAYVGSGVLGSALGMDKAKAKEVLAHAGIPQADYVALHETELTAETADEVGKALGLPCFVKPANLGSSIGVTKAHDLDELRAGIDLAFTYDEWCVIEECIDGREIEIAVLGNESPRVSVPGEILPGAEFYDYEDKYHDGRVELIIPAELDAATTLEMGELAIRAFKALRAEGMARVDFFLEDRRGLIVNEINTIPGFTPFSMYPQMWRASGLPYDQLIDELVRLALERHERRAHKRHTARTPRKP